MTRFSVIADAPAVTKGLVREFRVRWALEEIGMPYQEMRVPLKDLKGEENVSLQPFGQVPALQDESVSMFESAAIVLYLGENNEVLLPREKAERARAMSWVIAAVNSVEPVISMLSNLKFRFQNESWCSQAKPGFEELVDLKLGFLSRYLGGKTYLEKNFTAGDLMMTTVLRILQHEDVLKRYKNLVEYQKRNEERPAFQRALVDHEKLYMEEKK